MANQETTTEIALREIVKEQGMGIGQTQEGEFYITAFGMLTLAKRTNLSREKVKEVLQTLGIKYGIMKVPQSSRWVRVYQGAL